MNGPNLLDPGADHSEANLWLARGTATVMPLERSAKDEALANVEAFLARATADGESPKLGPDQVYPFRCIAASDGMDSYYTLQDVETSLVPMGGDFTAGRSVLGNHDYGTFSYGSTISGEVVPAQADAPEYEPAFYREVLDADPDIATSKWLITEGYVVRGLELNGNKSDSIIDGMRLGAIRRISISFTVGRYSCGICGQDMLQGWFGDPVPAGFDDPDDDAACRHFPGINYEDGYGFARMHGNRALEESLVYMNSSPSAMLMRKAEMMAERGVLSNAERSQVESRFGVRLPSFNRRVHATPSGPKRSESKEVEMLIAIGSKVRWTDAAGEQEGTVVATRQDDEATLTVMGEDGDVELRAEDVEIVEDEGLDEAPPAESADDRAILAVPTDDELAGHLTGVHEADVGDDVASDELRSQHDALHADQGSDHDHDPDEAGDRSAPASKRARNTARSEPTTAESVTVDLVDAAARLVAFAARSPDSFTTADSASIYGAERSVETLLVELGAERSVGTDVARQHEARQKALSEVLGGDPTVGRIRQLMQEAADGRQAKADKIRDAVAARVGVHGETFDADAYREMLQTQPVARITAELDSWQQAKRARYTPGRQVVPRDITKKGAPDKRAPARPDEDNLLAPRSTK